MKDVTLNQREQARLQVLNSVMEYQLPRAQAAELLGISERQVRRVLVAYRRGAADGSTRSEPGVVGGARERVPGAEGGGAGENRFFCGLPNRKAQVERRRRTVFQSRSGESRHNSQPRRLSRAGPVLALTQLAPGPLKRPRFVVSTPNPRSHLKTPAGRPRGTSRPRHADCPHFLTPGSAPYRRGRGPVDAAREH